MNEEQVRAQNDRVRFMADSHCPAPVSLRRFLVVVRDFDHLLNPRWLGEMSKTVVFLGRDKKIH